MAKKQRYLEQNKDSLGETLVLDSGNLFSDRELPADDEREAFEQKAKLYVKAYSRGGCAALNLGGNDLAALGLDFARALEKEASFPIISASILGPDGKPAFKPGLIVERGGAKFGILGLACPTTPVPEGFTVRDPVETAREGIDQLRKDGAQIVIVLSALGRKDVERVALEVKGIDLLLGDRDLSIPRFLEARGDALVLEAGQKGKHLNVITLHYRELGKRFVLRDMGQKYLQELEQLDQRLQRYASMVNSPPKPGTRVADPSRYKGIIERQLKDRAALVAQIKGLTPPDADAPFITFEAVAMNKAREQDPEVQSWVDAYKVKYPPKPGRGHAMRPTGDAARRIRAVRSVTPETMAAPDMATTRSPRLTPETPVR